MKNKVVIKELEEIHKENFKVGDVLTLKKGSRFYELEDGSDGLNKNYVENYPHLFEDVDEKNPDYDYINPDHYKRYRVEVIDMSVRIWGKEKVSDHCEITAFYYRMRMGTKPGQSIERDMEKEEWYLNKAKELREDV